MVARLVVGGADVNARFEGPNEQTPLHWAASSNDVEVLDALLDASACMNELFADTEPGRESVTDAFWQACHGGQLHAAKYVLERGADLNWIGYDESTPLEWLEAQGARSAKLA